VLGLEAEGVVLQVAELDAEGDIEIPVFLLDRHIHAGLATKRDKDGAALATDPRSVPAAAGGF
jgi:hypothetical protein